MVASMHTTDVRCWTQRRALALANVFSRGGATQQAIRMFLTVDKDGRGFIDQQKMVRALGDLGVLENMKATTLGRFMTKELKTLGIVKDGLVSLEQFVMAYETLAGFQARADKNNWQAIRSTLPQVPPGYEANSNLKRCFRYFCGVNSSSPNDYKLMINGERFAKVCMDAGLVEPEGQLPPFAVDIVFTRCKPGGDRYLPYRHFLTALAILAQEAGLTFEEIVSRLGCRNTSAQVAMETSRSRRVSDAPSSLEPPSTVKGSFSLPRPHSPQAGVTAFSPSRNKMTPPTNHSSKGFHEQMGKTFEEMASNARHKAVADIQHEMSTHKSRLMSRLQELESLLGAPKGARSLASDPNTPAEPVETQERLSITRGQSFVLPPEPPKPLNFAKLASAVVDEVHKEMDSIKNALVRTVEEQFKSLEGRLQAGEQARSYVNEVRLQDISSRTAQLEAKTRGLQSASTTQRKCAIQTEEAVASLSQRVASMEELQHSAADLKNRTSIVEEAVGGLRLGGKEMEQHLLDQSHSLGVALEQGHKRMDAQDEPTASRREARLESMLLQVASKVELLDAKIQEEQQLTLRAFEAILKGQQNKSTQN